MLSILLFALASAPEPAVAPYVSLATDAGFATDAGSHGEVIEAAGVDTEGRTEAVVAPRVVVRVEGLKMLPAELILDILQLPARAFPTAKTASDIQRQVLSFLVRTGFELATVSARVEDGAIVVDIQEGQVDRIVYVGALSYQLMRFKMSLVLPDNVFSRPLLERQIRELSERLNVPGVYWELVRTSEVVHKGLQVTEKEDPADDAPKRDLVLHARRPYEIRVHFPENTLGTTLGLDLRSNYSDGFELGVHYPGRPIFAADDGWLAEGSAGMGLRTKVDSEKIYSHFSRAALGLRYHTGPVSAKVRAHFSLESNIVARQRADVNVENYYALTTTAGFFLEYEARKGLQFAIGTGAEWQRVFDFEVATGLELPPGVGLYDRKRPFLRIVHESVVDPTVMRWDRRHTLISELRQYFAYADQPSSGWIDARYQFLKEFGWNDFWLKSRVHFAWGPSSFHDDLSVGEFLRALFGNQFVPSAANLQLEYRVSFARDLIKLSLFHDLVVMALPQRADNKLLPRLANGFGPGAHFLVQDLFQLDAYLAFGFRGDGEFGTALSVQIQKAF